CDRQPRIPVRRVGEYAVDGLNCDGAGMASRFRGQLRQTRPGDTLRSGATGVEPHSARLDERPGRRLEAGAGLEVADEGAKLSGLGLRQLGLTLRNEEVVRGAAREPALPYVEGAGGELAEAGRGADLVCGRVELAQGVAQFDEQVEPLP